LLFIDEFVHGLFEYDDMADNKNWVFSAVLAKSRPLDKAFHSAVVATEVLLFRQIAKQHPNSPCAHPKTAKLLEQTRRSIEECRESVLMKPRARYLLERCATSLKETYDA
jgi:hypothetical protein